jgi:hypothetical protein
VTKRDYLLAVIRKDVSEIKKQERFTHSLFELISGLRHSTLKRRPQRRNGSSQESSGRNRKRRDAA